MGKRRADSVPRSGDGGSPGKKKSRLTAKPLGSAEVSSADFALAWRALPSRRIDGGMSGFSVSVSQRIRRKNKQEMWKSVAIECDDGPDGGLLVRVLVCDPGWDRPMQIATLRSRPDDLSSLTPMGCNLDHIESESR